MLRFCFEKYELTCLMIEKVQSTIRIYFFMQPFTAQQLAAARDRSITIPAVRTAQSGRTAAKRLTAITSRVSTSRRKLASCTFFIAPPPPCRSPCFSSSGCTARRPAEAQREARYTVPPAPGRTYPPGTGPRG